MDFGGHPYTLEHLVAYTETAARFGFVALSANDHMVFSVPWLSAFAQAGVQRVFLWPVADTPA